MIELTKIHRKDINHTPVLFNLLSKKDKLNHTPVLFNLLSKKDKLNLLIQNLTHPIQKKEYERFKDQHNVLKHLDLYFKSMLMIHSLVNKRHTLVNNNSSSFLDSSMYEKNFLEIYIHVKYCEYYKEIIYNDWSKYELLINELLEIKK